MPELPDLLHVVGKLRASLVGRRVTAARLREPVILRCMLPGDLSLLVGHALSSIERHLHFVAFRFGDTDLVVSPMLAGRFRLAEPKARTEASLAFALDFGGLELRYLDDKKMGKAYLVAPTDWAKIPGLAAGGVDVLSPAFTLERFRELLAKRRDQVRVFLLDKSALDSLGNAYADEVLWEARIHPKTWCRSLTPDDTARLHAAIGNVLRAAIDEVARRDEPTEVKVRDFLKVRLKDVCPRCAGKIRRARVRAMDASFCPTCQPATRASFVDWTRTGN